MARNPSSGSERGGLVTRRRHHRPDQLPRSARSDVISIAKQDKAIERLVKYRPLKKSEKLKAGYEAKDRVYVDKSLTRITKRTRSISKADIDKLQAQAQGYATPKAATRARKEGLLQYTTAGRQEQALKSARTKFEKSLEKRTHALEGKAVGGAPYAGKGKTKYEVTSASADQYVKWRRRKLAGEHLDYEEWIPMIDMARELGDPEYERLRRYPAGYLIREVA